MPDLIITLPSEMTEQTSPPSGSKIAYGGASDEALYIEWSDALVWLLENTPNTEFSTDTNVTTSGVYTFLGATGRTFSMADGIAYVELRTGATATLSLSGSNLPSMLGTLPPGSRSIVFRWNATLGKYIA